MSSSCPVAQTHSVDAAAGVLPLDACIYCLTACKSNSNAVMDFLRATPLGVPTYPILSQLAHGVLSDETAQDPEHWGACYR